MRIIIFWRIILMMVRKEDKIKKKKKIITDALKACLERDVYSKITVQDIADESGFSKGGVLHYFQTKEDIYLDLIADIFAEFEQAHASILEWNIKIEDVGPISALVGAEKFILDSNNMRIIINLLLYAFEDEKIMAIMRKNIRKQHNFYNSLIKSSSQDKPEKKFNLEPKYLSRIAQTIVLFIGLLEVVDPIDIDHVEIVKVVSSLLRG